jgi:hypothetical protein
MALGLSLRAGGDARGRRRATDLVALATGLFGLVVAVLAFGVLAWANAQWTEIAGYELVGLSYIVAGIAVAPAAGQSDRRPSWSGITSFIPCSFAYRSLPLPL